MKEMSKAKQFAFIGCILCSVNAVLKVVNLVVELSSGSLLNRIKDAVPKESSGTLTEGALTFATIVAVVAIVFSLVFLAVYWIGFTKIGKGRDKGWKIFFLVMGILGCLGGIASLLTLGGMIGLASAVCFILVFALKDNEVAE